MGTPPNLQRARRAYRHPGYVFTCNADAFRASPLFKYPDTLPAKPLKILPSIGLNWVKGKSVAYFAWAVIDRRNRFIGASIKNSLMRFYGEQDGRKYVERLRLKSTTCNLRR